MENYPEFYDQTNLWHLKDRFMPDHLKAEIDNQKSIEPSSDTSEEPESNHQQQESEEKPSVSAYGSGQVINWLSFF